MTAREFRIRHGTKSMPIVPSDYMRCKAFKREEKFRDISSCLPTIIFPITWPPQRAQCSEPCPGVSSSRKENLFIEGREKRVHSSTICFLSCNIHPLLGLGLDDIQVHKSSDFVDIQPFSCDTLLLILLNLTCVHAFISVNLLPVLLWLTYKTQ